MQEKIRRALLVILLMCVLALVCQQHSINVWKTSSEKWEKSSKELEVSAEKWKANYDIICEEQFKLEKENDRLQSKVEKLSKELDNSAKALESQLSRSIGTEVIGEVANYPILTIAEDVPLDGYLRSSESAARAFPMHLKSDYTVAFLQCTFDTTHVTQINVIQPNKEELKLVLRENAVLDPLNEKGIHVLKFIEDGEEEVFLAFKWGGDK